MIWPVLFSLLVVCWSRWEVRRTVCETEAPQDWVEDEPETWARQ